MDEFRHRQDVLELSIASLARLAVLLRSLRIAANLTNIGLDDLNRRLQRPLDPCKLDPLVIMHEHVGEARALIAAIEDSVQHVARRLGSGWRRGSAGAHGGEYDLPLHAATAKATKSGHQRGQGQLALSGECSGEIGVTGRGRKGRALEVFGQSSQNDLDGITVLRGNHANPKKIIN